MREVDVQDAPTLFLTVGLPCTGKTTAARRLEEAGALRLTVDEWLKAIFGPDNPVAGRDVVEGQLIDVALQTVTRGLDVVLDFGLWSRAERTCLRQAGAEVGARVELVLCAVPPDEQRRRRDRRQHDAPDTTWPISDAELDHWATLFEEPTPGELDGSEPLDRPPPGFDSWAAWRLDRWPRSVEAW